MSNFFFPTNRHLRSIGFNSALAVLEYIPILFSKLFYYAK